ncbi:hypothetical protein H9Q70_001600 [Fusarium xylarioides]|nr:hypothetical protein H9Q70_001600 [Fusarium xylarioides]
MLAFIWLHLLGTCLAQNSSLPKDCPSEIQDFDKGITFNASGTLPVKFKGQDDPWYISTAVTDERNKRRALEWLQAFISVPRKLVGSLAGKNVEVCPYMLKGLNNTSENPEDADESCKGVVSDECIEEFENLTLPLVPPRNFSTARCSLDKMPFLDIPDDHKTYGTCISSGYDGDENTDDFEMHDLRVQQTIPIFMMVSSNGVADTKLLCIAPNKVVSGSRKPELKLEETGDEDEDENKASRVGGLGAVFLSIGVMIFTLL